VPLKGFGNTVLFAPALETNSLLAERMAGGTPGRILRLGGVARRGHETERRQEDETYGSQ
jgi:hypothetical protein